MSIFKKAFDFLIKHEGGYVNHPSDPGGETKFGISKRYNPYIDIKNLTIEDAQKYYKNNWFEKNNFQLINNENICIKVFDLAVNLGAKKAIKMLQRAIKYYENEIVVDGILGLNTSSMLSFVLNHYDNCEDSISMSISCQAALYYELRSKRIFWKGLFRRAYAKVGK